MLVLEAFTAKEPEWALTDLAQHVGISKSMAHRLLATMMDRGFIDQNPRTRRYRLGLRLLGLGAVVGDHLRIRQAALPHMEALAGRVDESVFLNVVDHEAATMVARVDLRASINWRLNIGERSPLIFGASNKILLAYVESSVQELVIAKAAASGLVDPGQLRAELTQIAQRGWAFTVGEVTRLTAAVAVPIIGERGDLLGGLSIAGPAGRFPAERVPELALWAQEEAMAIARHYQYGDSTVG